MRPAPALGRLPLLAPFTLVLAFGALCWLAGNLVWQIGDDALAALPW